MFECDDKVTAIAEKINIYLKICYNIDVQYRY
jgi:hypothetical protein